MGKQGFTLVELLVSISIIMLLVAIGVPSYKIMRNSVALSGESEEIVNALRTAQNRAMTSQDGTVWGVHFEASSFTVFGDDWTTPIAPTTYQLDSNLEILSATPLTVTFERLTGTSSENTIVVGFSGGKQKTIEIKNSGRISKL